MSKLTTEQALEARINELHNSINVEGLEAEQYNIAASRLMVAQKLLRKLQTAQDRAEEFLRNTNP